ncbi:MAG: WD40/YVTN/BNR-like repeat-containing protein [Gaiellaceae bacterium]
MAKAKTKARQPARRVQHPQRKTEARQAGKLAVWLPLLLVVVSVVGVAFLLSDDEPTRPLATPAEAAGGLPETPDYHSLLVSPEDAERLFLGTHAGLFETQDGGRTWAQASLVDRDAMNLARTPAKTIWAAGHGVLAKSTDAGETWEEVSPPGLPHLDVHGFAADPKNAERLYAAIANDGLYRSLDGGASFSLVSKEVGPAVFGLAVTPSGAVLAGDTQKGVFMSRDGGTSWKQVLKESALGIAVNPRRPKIVLAAGTSGLFRSLDQGETWKRVLSLDEGGGPLAWSPSEPDTAYAVGFDRTLYRTGDRGATWTMVS